MHHNLIEPEFFSSLLLGKISGIFGYYDSETTKNNVISRISNIYSTPNRCTVRISPLNKRSISAGAMVPAHRQPHCATSAQSPSLRGMNKSQPYNINNCLSHRDQRFSFSLPPLLYNCQLNFPINSSNKLALCCSIHILKLATLSLGFKRDLDSSKFAWLFFFFFLPNYMQIFY